MPECTPPPKRWGHYSVMQAMGRDLRPRRLVHGQVRCHPREQLRVSHRSRGVSRESLPRHNRVGLRHYDPQRQDCGDQAVPPCGQPQRALGTRHRGPFGPRRACAREELRPRLLAGSFCYSLGCVNFTASSRAAASAADKSIVIRCMRYSSLPLVYHRLARKSMPK